LFFAIPYPSYSNGAAMFIPPRKGRDAMRFLQHLPIRQENNSTRTEGKQEPPAAGVADYRREIMGNTCLSIKMV